MNRMIEQQRKSVFITPEDELIYKENREESDRCTARYEDGRPRLIPGVNLMDALEKLARIEERSFGVCVIDQKK